MTYNGKDKKGVGPGEQPEVRIARLEHENAKLNKIVRVLMERVERNVDQQGDAFTLFQTAITLEETVKERTHALKLLNERLMRELQERERVEEALLVAKAQAEDANASKTKFLAAASHDLRQPLNAARLFVATLSDRPLDGEAAKLVSRITMALDALDELLSVLLDISQLDAGGIKPLITDFKLESLLSRILSEYTMLGQKKGLSVKAVKTSAIARTDSRLLETMLRNLLANAVRYTPTGKILVGCRRTSSGCRIEVWDTGIGIEPQHLQSIFEEFRQVHDNQVSSGRGIGLGLSIVDRVSKLLGLPVQVKSIAGKGSVFSIEIPWGDIAKVIEDKPQLSASLLQKQLAGQLVVVIDNDEVVLDAMAGLLQSWGAQVVVAVAAENALAEIIDRDQRPDLIIADYHLDGEVKGTDAIREIAAEFEGPIPALVLTSDRSAELREILQNKGLTILHKPIQPARLRSALSHALNQ
jgi:signal transduction histidine kinase